MPRTKIKVVKIRSTELIPLTVLEAAEEELRDRTRLQKLCFLVQERLEYPEDYAFIPYDYGPYSKSAYKDIDRLEERGLVEEKYREVEGKQRIFYSLTEEGEYWLDKLKKKAGFEKEDEVREIVSEWQEEDIRKLLSYVFSEYPDYAREAII